MISNLANFDWSSGSSDGFKMVFTCRTLSNSFDPIACIGHMALIPSAISFDSFGSVATHLLADDSDMVESDTFALDIEWPEFVVFVAVSVVTVAIRVRPVRCLLPTNAYAVAANRYRHPKTRYSNYNDSSGISSANTFFSL